MSRVGNGFCAEKSGFIACGHTLQLRRINGTTNIVHFIYLSLAISRSRHCQPKCTHQRDNKYPKTDIRCMCNARTQRCMYSVQPMENVEKTSSSIYEIVHKVTHSIQKFNGVQILLLCGSIDSIRVTQKWWEVILNVVSTNRNGAIIQMLMKDEYYCLKKERF